MRTFVFDLDGTLLNTMADIGSACNEVLERHGYPGHPLPAYARMVGNGFDVLVRRALPADRMPDAAALAEITAETRSWYAGHMTTHTQPYAGMSETLASLARQGCGLAVLSNKPDAMCKELIPHYFPDIPFAHVQGALPEMPLKPDPASLLALLELMRADRAQACYVGDSNVDMITARNAGVAGIGAAWGFRGAVELREAGATLVVAEPADLAGLTSGAE